MEIPALFDQLTLVEKISLSSLASQPGYGVLIRLVNDICRKATEEVIKLDPTAEGYERKLKYLQARARQLSEFSAQLFKSIEWQTQPKNLEEPKRAELKPSPQINKVV